jgi:NAD(P)-dependent dehydrogenase (short-subunit alcohol dehydrogenase family)
VPRGDFAPDAVTSTKLKKVSIKTWPTIELAPKTIDVSSISSDFVPFNGASVYAMTKGAVASLTRGLARELGQ